MPDINNNINNRSGFLFGPASPKTAAVLSMLEFVSFKEKRNKFWDAIRKAKGFALQEPKYAAFKSKLVHSWRCESKPFSNSIKHPSPLKPNSP